MKYLYLTHTKTQQVVHGTFSQGEKTSAPGEKTTGANSFVLRRDRRREVRISGGRQTPNSRGGCGPQNKGSPAGGGWEGPGMLRTTPRNRSGSYRRRGSHNSNFTPASHTLALLRTPPHTRNARTCIDRHERNGLHFFHFFPGL